jgi:uncharacterized membrane protein
MKPAATSAPARLEYLDLIRGVFILVMIEGHTLRAFLSPEAQAGAIYRFQDLLHNLTGPAFLFASGASYVYSTVGHWEQYHRWSAKLRGRLARWLMVLVAAYALQLTYDTLHRTLAETTDAQFAFLVSLNILQCIIYSLVLLQLLTMMVRDSRQLVAASAAAAAAIALLCPAAWALGDKAPVWLGSFLSGHTRSLFPLFPYAGFTFAGVVWAMLHLNARQRGFEDAFLKTVMRWGALLVAAGCVIDFLPLPEIYQDFWNTSPQFFFLRVGIMLLTAVAARRLEPRLLPRWEVLAMAGRQSLLIYVLHLPVLYGSAFNPDTSLVKNLGAPLPVGSSIAVWLIFSAAMVMVAWCWDWWRRDHRWQARGVYWMVVGYYAWHFLWV